MRIGDNQHNPIRIAFAWNYKEWGGAQVYFMGVARRLKGSISPVFLFPHGTDDKFIEYIEKEGFEYRLLNRSVDITRPESLAAKLRGRLNKVSSENELVQAILSSGCCIAHVDIGPWYSLTAVTRLALKLPTFYTIHNRLSGIGWVRAQTFKLKFRIADFFSRLHPVATNVDASEGMREFASESFERKVTVAPTNIDPDEIARVDRSVTARLAARGKLGVSEDEILILTVAQFIDRKGRRVLLDAARRSSADSSLRFVWITSSNLDDEDRFLVDQAGVGARFRVATMTELDVDRKGLLELVASADIFVLPSLIEGLPIALMEAMALARPVVATRINGVSEAVTHGANGLLTTAGESDSLLEALVSLVKDRALRDDLGKSAEAILGSELTEPVVAARLLDAYKEALSDARA